MARPKLEDEHKKIKKSVTLSNVTIECLTALGNNNLSSGIEKAFLGYQAFRAAQGLPALKPTAHEAPNKTTKKKTTKKAR